MPSSEPQEDRERENENEKAATEPRPLPDEAASGKGDEPAWPPAEARPEAPTAGEAPNGEAATGEAPNGEAAGGDTASGEAPSGEAATGEAAAVAEASVGKREEPPAPEADEPPHEAQPGPAAEPKQEMGFSESTLHWLVDGDKPVEALPNDPGTAPHYDPRAPVAGRRRTVAVIGGAAIVAFAVAALLHAQAAGHRADNAADANEPAEVVTERAEAALAAGRSSEAMELARLAIAANPRLADPYLVVGKVERDSGRLTESRDAYRKYLDLAPIGTHAGEARAALAALPP